MADQSITGDYLIMGAGAAGMAFADSVLTETDATMVIVDRHDRPGGHWNDAYPFVRLHQPSSYYGVNSAPLGSGRIDEVGLNAGFHELAAGQEVLSHFDLVMRQRFLPSGRVRYFPMSEVGDDRVVTSLLSGERCRVDARRFVDATHSRMQVPSTTPPSYAVAAECRLRSAERPAPNGARLRRVRGDRRRQDRDGRLHLAARQRRRPRPDHVDRVAGLVGAEPGQRATRRRVLRRVLQEHRRSGRGRGPGRLGRRRLRPAGSRRRAAAHSTRPSRRRPTTAPSSATASWRSSAASTTSSASVASPRSTPDEIQLEQGTIPTGPAHAAHRLLGCRHPHPSGDDGLRRRPDHPAVGAHLPADLQRRVHRLRRVHVRRRRR